MHPTAKPTVRPITDSPWYWAYLFCTGALIAMVVIGPKYGLRQTQIEQNGQKRQWAARLATGGAQRDSSPTTVAGHSIPLWPLFVLLGSVLSVAWTKLIYDHLKRRSLALAASASVEPRWADSDATDSERAAAGNVSDFGGGH
jgi:hypothetical protein